MESIKSKKLLLFGSFAIFAIILSGCSLFQGYSNGSGTASESNSGQDTSDSDTSTEAQDAIIITYTDDGFVPATSKVKSGGTITWVNNSANSLQVGSANHPTHTVNQEVTNDQFVIELAPGESSEPVTVTKAGEWGFHDHLNASKFGKVTVE